MKLKRTYSISFDSDFAEKIESYKEENGLSYKEIFKKAIRTLLKIQDKMPLTKESLKILMEDLFGNETMWLSREVADFLNLPEGIDRGVMKE